MLRRVVRRAAARSSASTLVPLTNLASLHTIRAVTTDEQRFAAFHDLLKQGRADLAVNELPELDREAIKTALALTTPEPFIAPSVPLQASPTADHATPTSSDASAHMPISPKGSQWPRLFIRTALPFFAFGVCDNMIMLTVGDLIDEHFGVVMGFSTLVAAGLGQAVSDGSGVTIQCTIDRWATRMRLSDAHVDPRWVELPSSQRLLQVFRTIGIIVGCLVGLTPVLLWDTGNKPRLYDMLLKDLSEEHRRAVSAVAKYATFPAGTYILRRGDQVEYVDTIVSGTVRIVGRSSDGEQITICEQGPGEGIGFLEVVFGHETVADVVCLSDVRTLRIPRSAFDDLGISRTVFRQTLEDHIHGSSLYAPYLLTRPHIVAAQLTAAANVNSSSSLAPS
jgi:CRP-like cAMP-binding protein